MPVSGTNLMLPVGFHNSMETLVWQMEHRGVIYAPRSNMAIVAEVKDEARSYFYAPGTTRCHHGWGKLAANAAGISMAALPCRRRAPGGERG